MSATKRILITGAAGNLGGLLANYLIDSTLRMNLMIHKRHVDKSLKQKQNISIIKADLSHKESLKPALRNVDVVIHFAGILFKSSPEKFLPLTNTVYFKNLVDMALEEKVKRIILISFPHVEGETTIDNPANGHLNGNPSSMHAKTRLEEEKFLFEKAKTSNFEAVSLRVGMVYGKGILMVDAAKWFAKYWLLGIWNKPTWIHLISKDDFLEATKNAIEKVDVHGIYHLGDNGVQTLQEFLDEATKYWGHKKPWRMPAGLIFFAASCFELFSAVFRTRSPLTKDFIKIGMASYYGNTSRMKKELLPKLKYEDFRQGIGTM